MTSEIRIALIHGRNDFFADGRPARLVDAALTMEPGDLPPPNPATGTKGDIPKAIGARPRSRKSFLWYAVIALVVSLSVIGSDHEIIPGKGTWNILELRSVDVRFQFRKKPADNAEKDIALIVIDEKSYKSLNQPLIFFHTYISGVIDYLVECGVKTIGLDIELPSISLENRVNGGYDSVYTRSLLHAREKGVDVVIGFSSRETAPLQAYLTAAGQENLALFNLTEDADDFIRRQQLYGVGQGKRYDSFPYLLARKFTGTPLAPSGRTVLIDYSSARDIPDYSFHDVYRSSLQRDKDQANPFRNKVVIIGSSLPFEDKHSTPLDYFHPGDKINRTDGVVIHAATLNTLLSKSIFHEPDSRWGALYIVVVTMLTVSLCYNRRPIPAAVLCVTEAGLLCAASVYAFNHLYVMRVIPLLSAIVGSFGATTVFHYYTEERKRMKTRERFASYVPENIIDRIVDMDMEKLTEGDQTKVALLFCDIRGFTPYSESNRNEPRKVVRFLNQYHKEMTDIILGNDGTVAQLTGDGIFAFFGAPLELDDPVFAAVKSALQMKERIANLRQKWQEYGMYDLRIGIGIHFGDVIVGNIGSVRKMAYVAIGDNTNVASRIEGLTKEFGESILMSDAVYDIVRDKVVARPLGSASVKGHSDVAVFAADGLKGD